MKSTIRLTLDHQTGTVAIDAENLPDGESAYFTMMRVLSAAQNVVCDQLEERRLVVAKAFKPFFKI